MNIPDEYKNDIEQAVSILKKAGCTEMYVFGSLADGNSNPDSDIDIAVKGLAKEHFFKVYGKLLTQLEHPVDLISLDYHKQFSEILISCGNLHRVA